jgi:dolichyl-phosphate-mannose--protein O-mannosyl transferase
MYTYHSSTVLGSTHPFSSRWYEWIIMKRPIWYYSGTVSNGIKEGISSFGNPLVWWFGIPAFFYMIYVAFKNKDKTALFLVIGYIAQLVFWIPITRLTFIYHYFPCVPFIVLMLGYSINVIYEEAKNKKAVIIGAFVYAALVIVLFAMFYPVLSGQPVSTDYVQTFLKWFDSWVLI